MARPTSLSLAVQFLSKSNLQHEELGADLQEYSEKCQKRVLPPSGAYLLSMIAEQFELERGRTSALTKVELPNLQITGNSMAVLTSFYRKVKHVLSTMPADSRPNQMILGRWLFDRVRNVGILRRFIEQIEGCRVSDGR